MHEFIRAMEVKIVGENEDIIELIQYTVDTRFPNGTKGRKTRISQTYVPRELIETFFEIKEDDFKYIKKDKCKKQKESDGMII